MFSAAHSPLIEPDVQISRIRLTRSASSQAHAGQLHGLAINIAAPIA